MLQYYATKKHILVKVEEKMIDKEKCISCGACIAVCPVGAISYDDDGKAVIDKEICIKCHVCESVCPTYAIEIED